MSTSFLGIIILILGWCLFESNRQLDKTKASLKRYEFISTQEDFQRNLALDIASKREELEILLKKQGELVSKYKNLCIKEEVNDFLDSDISSKRKTISRLEEIKNKLDAEIRQLQKEVDDLSEESYVQSFGFYQPKYEFIGPGNYASQLQGVKTKQKILIRENKAINCHLNSFSSGSDKEKMVRSFQKMVLTIFNSECDSLASKIRYSSNMDSVESRLKKAYENLNKKSQVIDCEIDRKYLNLKLQEVHLKYQIELEAQEEREREKIMREDAKERQRTEKFMREAEEAEERENRFKQEIENALQEQELSHGVEKERLEIQIQGLNQKLEKARSDKDKANEQAAFTKAGYIYVISNIGSFGRDVYRICMTKKSGDPDDYVDNMAPFTPFPFDIHLKFVSENALETLTKMQQTFYEKRINKARNERRGFFHASLDEIIQAVEEIKKETGVIKSIDLNRAPQAYEYRRTQAIERKNSNDNSLENNSLINDIA